MSTSAPQKQRTGTRIAVEADYQGKRERLALNARLLTPEPSFAPEEEGSAIKQAIIRWLDAKK